MSASPDAFRRAFIAKGTLSRARFRFAIGKSQFSFAKRRSFPLLSPPRPSNTRLARRKGRAPFPFLHNKIDWQFCQAAKGLTGLLPTLLACGPNGPAFLARQNARSGTKSARIHDDCFAQIKPHAFVSQLSVADLIKCANFPNAAGIDVSC